ncbi:MAG: GNAT family N-acetyltransferase [Gemmatimonadetes bacterium]|nr:MAG: GNAT family N-acetyltransferase [Gemmatimonadota bacterium]
MSIVLQDDPLQIAGGITLRPYRPGDEAELVALYRRVFQQERTMAHWQWKFGENPAGNQTLIAQAPDGKMAAQYATVCARYRYQEQTIISSQIVDTAVDPKYRKSLTKKPLFEQLVDYAGVARGPLNHFCYGFPNSRAYRIAKKRFKYPYQFIHQVQAMVKRIPAGEQLSLPERLFFKTQKRRYDIRKIDRFDARADTLWNRVQHHIRLGIIRDATYLNWRYCDCPVVEYLPIGVFEKSTGELLGWAIFRANYPAQKNGLLVDWLFDPADAVVLRVLFRGIENSARIAGSERLETWLPPHYPQFEAVFTGHGFHREETEYKLVALPFRPDITLEWMTANWFYTMGDADLY